MVSEQEMRNRKPLTLAGCVFASDWWNDPEQKNYILYECNNPENAGGESKSHTGEYHGKRTYSCGHENEGMSHRCWSNPEKIAKCPIALTNTEPEVECERFVKEQTHPSVALVSKEGLKNEFYQPDALCISCGNCIEEDSN